MSRITCYCSQFVDLFQFLPVYTAQMLTYITRDRKV
jgi:hypothetical protein